MADAPGSKPQFSTGNNNSEDRPWWKKKRFIIPAAFVLLIIIGSAAGSDEKTEDASTDNTATTAAPGEKKSDKGATTTAPKLFPGRPDAQKEDKEQNIGGSVEFSGYTATVTAASFQQSLSDFEKDGYVVADVTVKNRDSRAQRYGPTDWKIQTPAGTVLDITFTPQPMLGSGDLVKDGEISGKVYFKVGGTKGDYYLIYKPDPFDSARGIWKVTV